MSCMGDPFTLDQFGVRINTSSTLIAAYWHKSEVLLGVISEGLMLIV